MISITAFYPITSVTSNTFKWMYMAKWPDTPAYHTLLLWQALLVAGISAMMIALVTIVLHKLIPVETITVKKEREPFNGSEVFQYT